MADVWFTADLHIGHHKVAEYRAEMMETSCAMHDEVLASCWDKLVGKDDVVWVLGDISAGGTRAQLDALEWLKHRPGTKHLIAGNHDGVHPMHRDSHRWFRPYMEVFDSVQLAAKRRIKLPTGHVTALLSHFPYAGDHTEEDRYPQWRLRNLGECLLHGHTHSTVKWSSRVEYDDTAMFLPPNQWEVRLDNLQIHVGVDAWDFCPVNLDQIVEIVQFHNR